MGKKGDKLTSLSEDATADLVDKLAAINGITSRKMFGGHGIFCNGKMFGIVDPSGTPFLKADDSNRTSFLARDAEKHGRMPYYAIPPDVLEDEQQLLEWAQSSISISL